MHNIKQRLLVAIVNYKSSHLVCALLESLIPQLDRLIDQVYIVDNFSQDESVEMISGFIIDNNLVGFVELMASTKNGGFSYGNNLAIKSIKSEPEFVLLLNPDTLVSENAIRNFLRFMQQHQKAGVVGSQIECSNGYIQNSAFRFHTIMSEIESSFRLGLISKLLSKWKVVIVDIGKEEKQVEWVSGACMLIRYDVIKDIGLMDEDYFLYFEETDFCLQAKRKGWECWYNPTSKIIHYVGQSTGIISGNPERPRRPQYWFESRQHYFIKNHGIFYAMIADLCWGLGFAVWRLRRIIQNKPDTDPEHMLLDFWKYSILLKPFKRKQ